MSLYVAERLEGEPVSSRVSTFPDVFSMAASGSKCTECGIENHGFDGDWRLESLVTTEGCLTDLNPNPNPNPNANSNPNPMTILLVTVRYK